MTPEPLRELLTKRIAGIDIALIHIGLGCDSTDAAETLRAQLIEVLGLLDRNSGLDAAADDLFRCVRAVVAARARGTIEDWHVRLLGKAHARFRARLEGAGALFIEQSGKGLG